MMKMTGWVFVLLMLVGAGFYYFYDTEESSSETVALRQLPIESITRPDAVNVGPVEEREQVRNRTEIGTPKVTEEQRSLVDQQQQKILQMALEYEAARDNPEQREAVRETMRQQLALYSEAVLPVAMEKMAATQSTN